MASVLSPRIILSNQPQRLFSSSSCRRHENPLGLPRRPPPPTMPRRGGPISKRSIPNVKKVVAVASGKGGVGKSTIAMNLAFALSSLKNRTTGSNLQVGLLDLDIFGPSVPTLMGLQGVREPDLTEKGAILPLTNHGIPCMSMGFLIPPTNANDNTDTPIVWRGLMVQKAVQQLLFDVDWSKDGRTTGLDVLVVDMPPGTGDVPLTLGQLVKVDGSVIVSTPQDVALSDVRKGIAMLRKVDVPITGLILNQAYYICPTCSSSTSSTSSSSAERPIQKHHLFGTPDRFHAVASQLSLAVLAELPLVQGVGKAADAGVPYGLSSLGKSGTEADGAGSKIWLDGMTEAARSVEETLFGARHS